jgi:UDP-N-acetyl-D-mannosaminuronic acid dehydrogenase
MAESAKKSICVIGIGYIGLPTAAMFATHGHKITGVDLNKKVIEALNRGEIIIEEPYLDIMVQAAVSSGNLTGSTKPVEADVFIIAVGTPINEDKTADLSQVISAAESIVPFLKKGNIVILESTCPPGTVTDILMPILAKSGLDVYNDLLVAHCPERVMPGRILLELVQNNRIIGGINRQSCEAVKDLYSTFVKGEIFLTDATTAEMCKLMENTYRDVNIALVNELALICEKLGINAWEVIQLSNKHPRIHLHQPGPGVGGHCIAVDPWFIVEKSPDLARMIKLGRDTNDYMPGHVCGRILEILNGAKGRKVTVLGVTYKADVDDIRESSLLKLTDLLKKEGSVSVTITDPYAKIEGIERNVYKAAEGSSLVVLGVNHREYASIDLDNLKKVMLEPNLLDTRNFFNASRVKQAGFKYYLLGSGREEHS